MIHNTTGEKISSNKDDRREDSDLAELQGANLGSGIATNLKESDSVTVYEGSNEIPTVYASNDDDTDVDKYQVEGSYEWTIHDEVNFGSNVGTNQTSTVVKQNGVEVTMNALNTGEKLVISLLDSNDYQLHNGNVSLNYDVYKTDENEKLEPKGVVYSVSANEGTGSESLTFILHTTNDTTAEIAGDYEGIIGYIAEIVKDEVQGTNSYIDSTKLKSVLNSTITSFKKSSKTLEQVKSMSGVVEIDDGTEVTTYAYVDGTDLYWYSDAETIYFPVDCSSLFAECSSLETVEFTNWSTSKTTNMYQMFYKCSSLANLNLLTWDTSNVTNMSRMFRECTSLETLSIQSWNTSKVTNMGYFVAKTNMSVVDLTSFNTSNVTNFQGMFYEDTKTQVIYVGDGWDTSKCTTSNNMFKNCSKLRNFDSSVIDITHADTTETGYLNVVDSGIDTQELTYSIMDLSKWKSATSSATHIYKDTVSTKEEILAKANVTQIDDGTELSSYIYTVNENDGMVAYWWTEATNFVLPDNVTQIIGWNCKTADLSGFDLSQNTDMSNMFYYSGSLESIDLTGWIVDNTTNMSGMFAGCSNLEFVGLEGWNVENMQDMSNAFSYCLKLKNVDFSGWKTTSLVKTDALFSGCSNLESVDLSGFDTTNLTSTSYMFNECTSLTSISVGENWQINSVEGQWGGYTFQNQSGNDISTWGMFTNCTLLPNFDSNVVDGTNANTSETGYLTLVETSSEEDLPSREVAD